MLPPIPPKPLPEILRLDEVVERWNVMLAASGSDQPLNINDLFRYEAAGMLEIKSLTTTYGDLTPDLRLLIESDSGVDFHKHARKINGDPETVYVNRDKRPVNMTWITRDELLRFEREHFGSGDNEALKTEDLLKIIAILIDIIKKNNRPLKQDGVSTMIDEDYKKQNLSKRKVDGIFSLANKELRK